MTTQVIVVTELGQLVAEGKTTVITGVAGPQGHSSGNIDGPAGAVDGHVAVFDGALGKKVRDAGFAPEDASRKGLANGYAGLGPDGKVPASQLPSAILGALSYQGVWNALANAPAIPPAAPANKGFYYRVSIAGPTVIDGEGDWRPGDLIASNGTTWDKIDNTDQVVSVAGLQGPISRNSLKAALAYTKADIGLAQVDNTPDAEKPISNAARAELDVLGLLFESSVAMTLDLQPKEVAGNSYVLSAADDRKLLVFSGSEKGFVYVEPLPPNFVCGVLLAGPEPLQVRSGLGEAQAPQGLLTLNTRYRFGVLRRLTSVLSVFHGGEAVQPPGPIDRTLFTDPDASGNALLLLF